MKVFLTGATGFVGSHVARVYAEAGAQLRVLTRSSSNVAALEGLDALGLSPEVQALFLADNARRVFQLGE